MGDRGEWAPNYDLEDPCVGVVRIDKTLPLHKQWQVLREEYQHMLVDMQRWFLEEDPDGDEDDGENGTPVSESGQPGKGDSDSPVKGRSS